MKLFLQLMGMCSTILFLIAGFQLINISSVSGNSIAESFYHGVGWMSFAFALFSGGLLIGYAEKIKGEYKGIKMFSLFKSHLEDEKEE